jgi:hypothetical protein
MEHWIELKEAVEAIGDIEMKTTRVLTEVSFQNFAPYVRGYREGIGEGENN